ncbi:MAG: GNAT family protein [bacterium]|nr:GNAT family protein [bacterium]MDE0602554.1 GNAT family protein [bacterium]
MNNVFHSIPPAVSTERLWLRRFRSGDARPLMEAVTESMPELSLWLPWARGLYGLSQARLFIKSSSRSWRRGRAFDFSVTLKDTPGRVVGGVGIWYTSRLQRTGEIGYWVRTDLTGRGVATEAARALVSVGFETMGLHRILMRIGVGNHPSRRVAEKLGFSYEGIAREEIMVRGRWMDHEVYSLLEQEWRRGNPV